MLKNALSIVL